MCPETSSYGWIKFTGSRQHKLLHCKEDTLSGDSGYTGLDKRAEMARKRKLRYQIAEKPSKLKQIKSKRELKWAERWEHTRASLRAKVEHPSRVIKRQFGYVKVRYRGLAKNTAQVLTLFALSNLWLKWGRRARNPGNTVQTRPKLQKIEDLSAVSLADVVRLILRRR